MIIYSKINRGRKKRFLLRTSILVDNNKRFSTKSCVFPESQEFLLSFIDKFNNLRLKKFPFYPVMPIIKNNLARFEYIDGVTLEEIFIDACRKGRYHLLEALDLYIDELKPLVSSENITSGFCEIFGNKYNGKMECLNIGCVDLNFDNIIFNKVENKKYLIDYEWTFNFPIPSRYIIFRAVMYFFAKNKHLFKDGNVLFLDTLNHLRISRDEEMLFLNWEFNFQSFVLENNDQYDLNNYIKVYERNKLKNDPKQDYLFDKAQLVTDKKNKELELIKSSKFWKMREFYIKIKSIFFAK